MSSYNSFFDLKLRFFHFVLSLLSRNEDIGLTYVIESTSFFKRKLETFFGPVVTIDLIRGSQKDGSLPSLPILSFRAAFPEEITISSSAVDPHEDLLFVKAAGEFLERVSTYLPLDDWKKQKFEKISALEHLKGKDVKVRSILDNRSKQCPTEDLYWGFPERKNARRNSTTNGGAGHFIHKKALLHAWLELIERDAFMVHWLTTVSPLRLELPSFSSEDGKEIERILRLCKRYGLEVYFFDMTSDIPVPACCAVVVSHTSPQKTMRKVSIGAASGFNAEKILLSALVEAVNVHEGFYDAEPFIFKEGEVQKIGRKERLSQVFTEESFGRISFFMNNTESKSLSEWITTDISSLTQEPTDNEAYAYLKKIFAERAKSNADYDVFSIPIANSLLDSFNYKVVRLMCDALYPLHLKEELIVRDHPRLTEFAESKGLPDVRLNTWPHLFP
jgi:thiazole/oxazole-forming peptide maturase SagD family component